MVDEWMDGWTDGWIDRLTDSMTTYPFSRDLHFPSLMPWPIVPSSHIKAMYPILCSSLFFHFNKNLPPSSLFSPISRTYIHIYVHFVSTPTRHDGAALPNLAYHTCLTYLLTYLLTNLNPYQLFFNTSEAFPLSCFLPSSPSLSKFP